MYEGISRAGERFVKELVFDLDNEFVRVKVQKIKGKLWYHVDGRTCCYSPELKVTENHSNSGVFDKTSIKAPMPGKIVKILKKEGEKVGKGETVVVMEAMKMEYNLKAQHFMKVDRILCEENQIVELGTQLVEMVPNNEGSDSYTESV